MSTRRKFSAAFKAKVVLEALKERDTIQEIGRKYEIHPNQVAKWKNDFLAGADQVFEKSQGGPSRKDEDAEKEKLYKIIGQQRVEIDFLKKALS